MNTETLTQMISHLERIIRSLPAPKTASHWQDYHATKPYTREQAEAKHRAVEQVCDYVKPKIVWCLGANDGEYSLIPAKRNIPTIALENDHAMVETMQNKHSHLLPLWIDLLTPSPASGWANNEHRSLESRGPADLVLCLALTHHLAFAGQVPLDMQARYFAQLGKHLLIEFISPNDPMVITMLARQPSLGVRYTQEKFERAFFTYFDLMDRTDILPEKRALYFLKAKP